jgi:hypothetical protein
LQIRPALRRLPPYHEDDMTETRAEIRLPSRDLKDDLPFFTRTLGMRLDLIYPADDPAVAVVSGHGLRCGLTGTRPNRPARSAS